MDAVFLTQQPTLSETMISIVSRLLLQGLNGVSVGGEMVDEMFVINIEIGRSVTSQTTLTTSITTVKCANQEIISIV